jgi:hypothetical protein
MGKRWVIGAVWARAGTLAVLGALVAVPVQAQTNGGRSGGGQSSSAATSTNGGATSSADSLEAVLAKADSARAALVQPPGTYGGVRPMDIIRAPFQLFGSTLALLVSGGGIAYLAADKVLIEPAKKGQRFLAERDISSGIRTFGPRSWPGVALRYEGLDPFYAEAGYSLKQYEHYEAGFDLGNERDGARLAGRYRRMRQPHFWGVGAESSDGDRSDYAQDLGTVGASLWWTPGEESPWLFAGGAAWEDSRVNGHGWDSHRPDADEVFDPADVFGLDDTTEYLHLNAGASLNNTAMEHLQMRGLLLSGEWHYFEGLDDTSSSFHRLTGDARAYIPANERQAFALRLLAEDHVGESGRGVPFTYMAELGDDRGLRGFSGGRFRDNAAVAAQLEWRYEVYWHPGFPDMRIEGFAFTDVGTVAPSLGSIDWSTVRATPGIGIRYVNAGDAKFEGFLANGGGEWRLGVALGRTF